MKKLSCHLAGILLLTTALGARAALVTYTISAPTNSWSGTIQVSDLNAFVLQPDPSTTVGTITAAGYGGSFSPDFQSTKGEVTWQLNPEGYVFAGLYIYSTELSEDVRFNEATWTDLVNNGPYALYLHPDPSEGENPEIFAMYYIEGVGSPYKALGGLDDSATVTFSTPIPEPGTWVAMAVFAGGAAFARWRKRKVA